MRADWLRLLAVIAVQAAILAAIPSRQVKARAGGTAITLETAPVDPLDPLSGYHVTLRYRAEEVVAEAPGERGAPAWLLVERGDPAWRGVACLPSRPATGSGQVALRAEVEDRRCRISSAGRFYIPEARRAEVDAALREARAALVDMRVDADGNVALVRLRAGRTVVEP